MPRWLMALLLRVYPPELRREFGDEIREAASLRFADARSAGPRAIAILLCTEVLDSLRIGLRARRLGSRRVTRQRRSNHPSIPDSTGARMLDGLFHDLRSGVRVFRSAPGFALAAVAVLAMAIGTNTAMFSVLDAVLLRPLPFADPDRLVAIYETNPERGWTRAQVAAANYLDWRERATTFAGIAAHNDWLLEQTFLREGEPEVIRLNEVTGNFFDVLGVPMQSGRSLEPGDDWQGGERRIVLSDGYWREAFGGDPEIVGSLLTVQGIERRVVGIAPPGLRYPVPEVDAWVPVSWNPENREAAFFRRAHGMRAIGRLADGATPAAARAELDAIASRLEAEYPELNDQMGVGFIALHEWIVGDTRPMLLLAFAAVGMVLLIGCVNVANMQLARATSRRTEMALRTAIGAGRRRLIRLGLAESLLLSLVGGLLGLGLASLTLRVVVAMLPADFPRLGEVGLDARVLTFAAAVVVLTGLAFGLAPAFRVSRRDPSRDLRVAAGASSDRASHRTAAWLVAVEIALVLPVAVGAALMFRTLVSISQVDPGFEAADTTVLGISLPRTRYADAESRAAFFDALLADLRAHEAVASAAISTRLPFVQQRWSSDFRAENWAPDEYGVGVRHDEISSDLFATMKVEFIAGRDLDPAELDGEPVAIVNRALADRYFPERSPVGERLCFDRAPDDCRYWYRVVGVVENVRRVSLAEQEEPGIYGSLQQAGSSAGFLLIRSALPTADVVDLATRAVRRLDPVIPFHTVTTMEAVVAGSVDRERLLLALFGAYAAVAAILAGFGVYGVVSYATARRIREMGIRASLGARPADLMSSVVARGMLPVGVGTIVGTTLAMVASDAMRGFVHGVGVRDPLSYLAVVAVLAVVALVACVVPGRRALSVDPMTALRGD